MRIAVGDVNRHRRASNSQLTRFSECAGGGCAFVEHDMNTPFHVADEKVEFTVTVPIGGKHCGGTCDLDRLIRLVLECLFAGKLALAQSLEEVKLAWPGAGEDVGNAVA